jgi:hypothetical protein
MSLSLSLILFIWVFFFFSWLVLVQKIWQFSLPFQKYFFLNYPLYYFSLLYVLCSLIIFFFDSTNLGLFLIFLSS